MSAVAAGQRPFTKCRGHIARLLTGYHKLSLVVCSLFIVSCQLSLVFARQTMCPVTIKLYDETTNLVFFSHIFCELSCSIRL